MNGASIGSRKPDLVEEKLSKIDAGNVIEEMKTFGKECKEVRCSIRIYTL